MLRWTLGFFAFALVAVLFGFGGIAAGGPPLAKLCFSLFILGFAIALIWNLVMRRRLPHRG